MTILRQSRRGFITGLGATLFAAPAIVRVASIMPVKTLITDRSNLEKLWDEINEYGHFSKPQAYQRLARANYSYLTVISKEEGSITPYDLFDLV